MFPDPSLRQAVRRGRPGEVSTRTTHRLHTTCNQDSGDERDRDAAPRRRSRGGRTAVPVLLIAEADLPEEAYAEIAYKMTPAI
jgi:hypothetical protein